MQKREFRKLILYGPHPLERDETGRLCHPMADIFPSWNSMIVGNGLHISLALEFMELLAQERGRTLEPAEEEKVYEDLVAVVLRGEHVVIRSTPDNMERCFRAAELLEEMVSSEIIRFTGSRDALVREAFKLRGESWKMTPRYFTIEEIISQIKLSIVCVGTANQYYYNMESGGRLITCQGFAAIREALDDYQELSARIHEVHDLFQRRNKQYVREVDFFMARHEVLDMGLLEKLVKFLGSCGQWGEQQRHEAGLLFDDFMANLRQSVDPEFQRDDPSNPVWRTYMYSVLNDIPPTEESMLGVSEEFNMNIRWEPGCRIKEDRVIPDPHVDERAASLLQDFFRFYGQLEYINLGQVMRSQSQKRAAGSYREVYIAVLKQKKSLVEQIRILRKVRRGTLYFLNHGYNLDRAQQLAEGYLQYTFDRRDLLSLIGVNTPPINCLKRTEDIPGIGMIPVEFFDRPYINGVATDKVSYYFYENAGFVRAQSALLGDAAALNLIVGRCDPDSGMVFFGDGDELLLFERDRFIPTDIVLADFTGVFADVVSPLDRFAPFYLHYLLDMLERVRVSGWQKKQTLEVADIFIDSMKRRIELTCQLLFSGGAIRERIEDMITDRDQQVNPVRIKWSKTVERLHKVPLDSFIEKFRSETYRQLNKS